MYPRHVVRLRPLVLLSLVSSLLVTLVGCAKVTVRKVPTPTQYVDWTDDMQREADRMTGIRFYLPRPFVNVFESFPVRTDIYIGDGEISPDGKYVIIQRIRGESEFAQSVTANVAVPAGEVWERRTGTGVRSQSSTTDKPDAPTTQPPAPTPPTIPATPPVTPAPQAPPAPRTGINQQRSTNNNGAFAYQPLRGNFDLVYLPDFEEQYVVESRAALGNANFEVNLGQGWSLQGFNSLTDNSEINARIFTLIDQAMKVAAAATGQFEIMLPSLIADKLGAPKAQSDLTKMANRVPGTPVSLKIVVVHYAAKGLYPVIKPRELQERIASGRTRFGVLDLFKLFPQTEWASQLDTTAIQRAQQAIDRETGTFTVPRYPYQYVSFNTFRYLAMEVIKTNSTPFRPLFHPTGTEGSPGAARTGEVIDIIRQLQEMHGDAPATKRVTETTPPPIPPVDFLSVRGAELAERLMEGDGTNKTTIEIEGTRFTVTKASIDSPASGAANLHVALDTAGDVTKEYPRDALRTAIDKAVFEVATGQMAYEGDQPLFPPDKIVIDNEADLVKLFKAGS